MATVRPSLICGSLLAAILFSTVCVAAQTPPPTLKTLYNFTGGSTGASPQAGVVIGSGGVFYGTPRSDGTEWARRPLRKLDAGRPRSWPGTPRRRTPAAEVTGSSYALLGNLLNHRRFAEPRQSSTSLVEVKQD